jgi:hypothetical protein
MLYSEIIAVCSEIHTKHIHRLCGQNVEFVNVKHGGTYSNHWALEDNHSSAYGPARCNAVYSDRYRSFDEAYCRHLHRDPEDGLYILFKRLSSGI